MPVTTADAKEKVVSGGAGATRKLAHHAATLRYESLPAALVELTKKCVMDTLGVCLGATTLAEEAQIVAEYVRDLAGKPESTILGFGGKAPAPWAAFTNGSLGHMLDYDGVNAAGGGHVNIATIPLAFAVAEKLGGVSGRDLITAIACGTDVQTRLYQSIDLPDWTMSEGWFPTQLLGGISGAATAGRLLGLNDEQMENAFGIAFNQMCGSRQMAAGAATHLRSMQAGFSAQAALLSADLARRGIVGSKEVLEGRYGLYKNYVRHARQDWEALLGDLGERFPLLAVHGFKVWPACGYTRVTNAAAQQLRAEFKLRPQDIASVTVVGGTGGTRLLSEPIELKRRPKTSIDGKYSIPFTTAVMLVKGNVTLHDFTEAGLRDPSVLAMADRVTYRPLDEARGEVPSAHTMLSRPILEIMTADGKLLKRQPESVPGDPKNPVARELLEAKFRDCVSFSVRPLSANDIERAIEMINNLEHIDDATEIIRLLA
jgi:2-methylcitrate dehydratase PrpD